MKNNIYNTNIYGTNYKITFLKKANDYMYSIHAVGHCDFENKEIYVLKNEDAKATLLHEMIHAYLWESGCQSYATDETLVELLTEIFERIAKG